MKSSQQQVFALQAYAVSAGVPVLVVPGVAEQYLAGVRAEIQDFAVYCEKIARKKPVLRRSKDC